MPWLTNKSAVETMLAAADKRGWKVDAWWRDEAALWDWWQLAGAAPDDLEAWWPVPAGDGVVAWVTRHMMAGGAACWVLRALAPNDGLTGPVPHAAVARASGGEGKLGARYLNQWMAARETNRAFGRLRAGEQWQLGAWVGGCRANGESVLALAAGINAERRELQQVELLDGSRWPAAAVAQTWFPLNGRQEAAAFCWRAGVAEWQYYIQMMSALSREQRRIASAAGEEYRPGKARGAKKKKGATEAKPPPTSAPPAPLRDGVQWDAASVADRTRWATAGTIPPMLPSAVAGGVRPEDWTEGWRETLANWLEAVDLI